MENKRLLIILLLLLGIAHVQAATAPQTVIDYYSGLQRLTSTDDIAQAEEIASNLRHCFGSSLMGGAMLPNDFRHFNFGQSDYLNSAMGIQVTTYLNNMVNHRSEVTISYKIDRCEPVGSAPILVNGKLEGRNNNMRTYVTKILKINNQTHVLYDTVITDNSTGAIIQINHPYKIETVTDILLKAAIAYEQKDYEKAFSLYQKAASREQINAEAYYRLGLMAFFNMGGKSFYASRKLARKDGVKYMTQASELNYTGAEQALFWMIHEVI